MATSRPCLTSPAHTIARMPMASNMRPPSSPSSRATSSTTRGRPSRMLEAACRPNRSSEYTPALDAAPGDQSLRMVKRSLSASTSA